MAANPRTWIEVSGTAFRQNYQAVQRLVGARVRVMPIVKAFGYGHDPRLVIRALRPERPWAFGVAHGDEALDLINQGVRQPLVVLSSWRATDLPKLLRHNVQVVAWDLPSLRSAIAARRYSPRRSYIHLKFDTGTSRIGFLPHQLLNVVQQLKDPTSVAGIFSHFANAEERGSQRTHSQINRFATLINGLPGYGGIRHIACTAAAIRYPEAYFGLIRLGIGLYGYWPSLEIKAWAGQYRPKFRLRPALSWKTRLIQVKRVPAGTKIGYGSTVTVKRTTSIGIIPIGYYDGLDRKLSNRGRVFINRQPAPILGRVCMNMTILQLPQNAKTGDVVEVLGPDASVETMASAIDTIPYEIISRINPTIQRFLL